MAQKWSKRIAYIIVMFFRIVVQTFLLFIKQGDITLILVFSFLAGLSVSTAHVMPEALFPDVIDWDELRTDTRREGMYYRPPARDAPPRDSQGKADHRQENEGLGISARGMRTGTRVGTGKIPVSFFLRIRLIKKNAGLAGKNERRMWISSPKFLKPNMS